MTGFLIALLSGALMSVQGVFNTQVTKTTGMWVSNGWVQFSAFLLCAAAWLIDGRDSIGNLWKVRAEEQKVVERLTAALGGGNEDLELLADGLLPDIFVEKRRAQRAVDVLFVGTGRAAVDDAFFLKHS